MNSLITLLLGFTIVVLVAQLSFSRRLLLLVAVGLIAGQWVEWQQFDTGIDAAMLSQGILLVVLPLLVLDLATRVSLRRLRRIRWWVLLQGLLTFLLLASGIALALFWFIDHPGFPWRTALVAGVILAAVDPGWCRGLFSHRRQLETWLEGEALVVDAVALTLLALLWTAGPLQAFDSSVAVQLGETLAYSAVVAVTAAGLGWLLCRLNLDSPISWILWGWWTFLLAEVWLSGSGVVALFGAVILVRLRYPMQVPDYGQGLADGLLLLLGFSLTMDMFTERYLTMGLAVMVAWFGRWLSMQCWLYWPRLPLARRDRPLLWQIPCHGPVTLALVLALPVHLDAWWTVQAIGYGVILADLLIILYLSRASKY